MKNIKIKMLLLILITTLFPKVKILTLIFMIFFIKKNSSIHIGINMTLAVLLEVILL